MGDSTHQDCLSYGVVHIVSRYIPTDTDKVRYQSADVVNQIIQFETGIEQTLESVRETIDTAEEHGRGSAELTRLKVITEAYARELEKLNSDVNVIQQELLTRAFESHGFALEKICNFDVSGYQFTAKPVSEKMNYIISNLFSFGDIANINMRLIDVKITGNKKPRKGNVPTHLMIELWRNETDDN